MDRGFHFDKFSQRFDNFHRESIDNWISNCFDHRHHHHLMQLDSLLGQATLDTDPILYLFVPF